MPGKFAAVALLAVLAFPLPARAGSRIESADPEFPQDVSVYYFQAGKARVEGALEGLTVIVDVKNAAGWLLDVPAKRYAGGPLAALSKELRKIDVAHDDDAGARGPAGQKAATEPARPLVITVKDLGAGERILGYETRRVQVLLEGELLEELWLAPKIQVGTEVDLEAFGDLMQKMLDGGEGLSQGYEESAAYRRVRAGGYPLRQVLYFVGEKSTLAVTSVAIKDFPASDFTVPKDFVKIGYAELLLGGE
jgi:hypothetical protein